MRAWSVPELDNVILALRPLLGARLQEVKTSGHDIVLGFYAEGELLWLWVDLNTLNPGLLPWPTMPLSVKGARSPVQLFLRAHFVGRPLLAVEREQKWGRVVRMDFGESRTIEVRLFPHGPNFLVWSEGKSLSWKKPAELREPGEVIDKRPVRDLETLRAEWLARRGSRPAFGKKRGQVKDPVERIRSEIERRQKALQKVDEEIQRKSELPWREVGQWLKGQQSLEVPSQWSPFVDKRRKLAWNIDQCFQKAREVEGKIQGTLVRRATLEREIAELEARLRQPLAAGEVEKPALKPFKAGEVDGRSYRVNEELVAVVGKNAADNLKLLRKARPWDFWLHLRDRPGAHGILFRNKTTSVQDAVLRDVIAWLVKMQFGAKLARHSKEKIPVIVAECRYVRPIKGDRLGRVNYSNERILIYQVP